MDGKKSAIFRGREREGRVGGEKRGRGERGEERRTEKDTLSNFSPTIMKLQ
jgi:hypothetical protein